MIKELLAYMSEIHMIIGRYKGLQVLKLGIKDKLLEEQNFVEAKVWSVFSVETLRTQSVEGR